MAMQKLDVNAVREWVGARTVEYYQHQEDRLGQLTLGRLLQQNPYYLSMGTTCVYHLIEGLLEAYLCSDGDILFSTFLADLAIFIAGKTCRGHKSAATGVDLEFFSSGVHYVVSIKSGPSWGNSSQQDKLQADLQKAVATVKQTHHGINVQPVLGICYGKTATSYLRGYLKVVGQNFWYLISGNQNLYTDIIEPVGYRARHHNDAFLGNKSCIANRFTAEFIAGFCDKTGAIDWVRLVEWNSGNLDLDDFIDIE